MKPLLNSSLQQLKELATDLIEDLNLSPSQKQAVQTIVTSYQDNVVAYEDTLTKTLAAHAAESKLNEDILDALTPEERDRVFSKLEYAALERAYHSP